MAQKGYAIDNMGTILSMAVAILQSAELLLHGEFCSLGRHKKSALCKCMQHFNMLVW